MSIKTNNKRNFIFLRTFDLYITKEYFKIFFYGMLVFAVLITCYNLALYQSTFLSKEDAARGLSWFLLLRLPPDFITVLPIIVFITVLYKISEISLKGETTVLRSVGFKVFRIGLPVILSVLIVSIFATTLNSEIIPKCNLNSRKFILSVAFNKEFDGYQGSNMVYKTPDSQRVWYFKHFDNYNSQRNVSIKKYDINGFLLMELLANKSSYYDNNGWQFEDGKIVYYGQASLPNSTKEFLGYSLNRPSSEIAFSFIDSKNQEYKDIGIKEEKPSDIFITAKIPTRLTFSELIKILNNPDESIEMKKNDIRTEITRRFSLLPNCVILSVIAVFIGSLSTNRKAILSSVIRMALIVCVYLFSFYAGSSLALMGFGSPYIINSIGPLIFLVYACHLTKTCN